MRKTKSLHAPICSPLRAELLAGQQFSGPAIVTQDDTTSCILDGFSVAVDALGNLILSSEG